MLDSLLEVALVLAVIVAKQIQGLCGWCCPGLVDR